MTVAAAEKEVLQGWQMDYKRGRGRVQVQGCSLGLVVEGFVEFDVVAGAFAVAANVVVAFVVAAFVGAAFASS